MGGDSVACAPAFVFGILWCAPEILLLYPALEMKQALAEYLLVAGGPQLS
jgi:hypothetical protein